MPRSKSRSRSPRRDRRRSRSRDRDRDRRHRDRDRDRHRRSRSRTPPHHQSRSISPGGRKRSRSTSEIRRDSGKSGEKKLKSSLTEKLPKLDASQLADMTEEEIQMMQVMGFSGFDSTKGKKVEGNDIYEANISRKRRYRQYMNRRGGFNRPLDFIA